MVDVTMRAVTADEFGTWARAVELPFYADGVPDEKFDRWREVFEPERAVAAFEGERIVGTAAVFSYELSVPGGVVPMGGVTAVGVHPTHRRRGLLRSMMRRIHDEMATSREPLAGLWAAESPIYGRFGYGIAAQALEARIDRTAGVLSPDVPVAEEPLRLVSVDDALRLFPAVHDEVRRSRPGMPGRNDAMWRSWLCHDFEAERNGYSRRYLAWLPERGYVVYRVKSAWRDGLPAGSVEVSEHMAVDAAAAAALWRYVFGLDLVTEVEMEQRPVDDLLLLQLVDQRRLRARIGDSLWLRLVRVGEALAARTYSTDDSIVFDVADDFLTDNARRWRLDAATVGARCEPTTAAADLRVRADGLGGAYLGNLRFTRLVHAGLAEERTPGAAARADRLFLTDAAPWCPQVF